MNRVVHRWDITILIAAVILAGSWLLAKLIPRHRPEPRRVVAAAVAGVAHGVDVEKGDLVGELPDVTRIYRLFDSPQEIACYVAAGGTAFSCHRAVVE